jgi:hypothetical protein
LCSIRDADDDLAECATSQVFARLVHVLEGVDGIDDRPETVFLYERIHVQEGASMAAAPSPEWNLVEQHREHIE